MLDNKVTFKKKFEMLKNEWISKNGCTYIWCHVNMNYIPISIGMLCSSSMYKTRMRNSKEKYRH